VESGDDAEPEADGDESEPIAGVEPWSGGVLDCMLVSELGVALSVPVLLACWRAQAAASASTLTDKIIKLRFIKAPRRSWD
jgi:hypothetical protein